MRKGKRTLIQSIVSKSYKRCIPESGQGFPATSGSHRGARMLAGKMDGAEFQFFSAALQSLCFNFPS